MILYATLSLNASNFVVSNLWTSWLQSAPFQCFAFLLLLFKTSLLSVGFHKTCFFR